MGNSAFSEKATFVKDRFCALPAYGLAIQLMTSASPALCHALEVLTAIFTALIFLTACCPLGELCIQPVCAPPYLVIHVGKGEGLRVVKYRTEERHRWLQTGEKLLWHPNPRRRVSGTRSPTGRWKQRRFNEKHPSATNKTLRSKMIYDGGFLLVSLEEDQPAALAAAAFPGPTPMDAPGL